MSSSLNQVLIVGGGVVGLSSALFLASRNVPVILVERHPGISKHPRAVGFTARSVELFRSIGLGPQIPLSKLGGRPRRMRVESLAGQWFEEQHWSVSAEGSDFDYSPCTAANLTQDRLEPLLRSRAIELGADIRFDSELVSFDQHEDSVKARIRRPDGSDYEVAASWLIAADGHRSAVRKTLGIGRAGRGPMRIGRSVMFRASLQEYLDKGFVQFTIDQPRLQGFMTTYGDGRWILQFSDDTERSIETWRELIVRAIGRNDVEVEIITVGRWEISALIADRFAAGRVFLAGDAAHTLPPNRGGYGANTGIEDVHNLAWKLAAVMAGEATPGLLDTYDAERRPVAWLRHDQIFARDDFASDARLGAAKAEIIDDRAMEFGQLYRSQAVAGGGADLPPANLPDVWRGQPGTRAPHLWIERASERISTLDLFGSRWLLMSADERWSMAVRTAAERLSAKIDFARAGIDFKVDLDLFRSMFGLGETDATLIRPDGYVAWRAPQFSEDGVNDYLAGWAAVSAARPA